ncbi:MAG: acyl--CoA ligase [Firmicutes bacterium]|nr:acyl--CoA ligase [Bacillota bacterium]
MIRRLLINQPNQEKIAVIENDREILYLDLLHKASALQPLLPQRQHENIAIFLPDGSDFVAAFWGTIQAGMTAFPLNVLLTRHEIMPLLKQASVGTVITSTAYSHIFAEMQAGTELPLKVICLDRLRTDKSVNGATAAEVSADKPMVLLTTSGTTAKAKIVMLSEKNIAASLLGYLEKMYYAETELNKIRYVLAAPFASVYGLMILCACLARSFPLVLLDHAFTLDGLYRTAEKHRVTHYEGGGSVLLLMERLAGRPIPYDIHTLNYFGFGGSKVSAQTIENVLRAYPGITISQGYGMTETSPQVTKFAWDRPIKPDSAGLPIRDVEIAVETAAGITRTPHTRGEILVKGPNVMLGYYNNRPATDEVLKNGYLYTGDIGYLDEEGYLYICGRKKRLINVRGFNVYPEEVEACIQNSRLAKDCFVYGQADESAGEIVCADIVPMYPQVQAEDVAGYCRSHLAEFKQPQRISLCAAINRNSSWKTEG